MGPAPPARRPRSRARAPPPRRARRGPAARPARGGRQPRVRAARARGAPRSPEAEALNKVGVDDSLARRPPRRRRARHHGRQALDRAALLPRQDHAPRARDRRRARHRAPGRAGRAAAREGPRGDAVRLQRPPRPGAVPGQRGGGELGIREEQDKPTNRNFPDPDKDLAASGGKDATGPGHPAREPAADGADGALQAGADHQPPRHAAPGEGGRLLRPAQADGRRERRGPAASARPRPSDSEGSSEARYRALYEARSSPRPRPPTRTSRSARPS